MNKTNNIVLAIVLIISAILIGITVVTGITLLAGEPSIFTILSKN